MKKSMKSAASDPQRKLCEYGAQKLQIGEHPPAYELDEGPLTAAEFEALRDYARSRLSTGRLIEASSLFPTGENETLTMKKP